MKITEVYNSNSSTDNIFYRYMNKVFGSSNSFFEGKLYSSNALGFPRFDSLIDDKNEYLINSKNFRSDEFSDNIDVIFAGCSNTYGIGIPEKSIWGSVVSGNKKYANLSICGASAELICRTITTYLKSYSRPKEIYCLFPDFFRMIATHDKNFHIDSSLHVDSGESHIHLKTIDGYGDPNVTQKYAKIPFELETSISPHESIYRNVMAVFNLQELCNALGIKFFWSTWDATSEMLLSNIISEESIVDKNSFINLNVDSIHSGHFKVICQETHDHPLKDSIYWNLGTDKGDHPGIHWHYHVSEKFIERINLYI